jgi:hypothetical protein
MRVEGDEVKKLPVDDPSGAAVAVFAFYPEYGLVALQRMQAVADADAEVVQQERHSALIFLVTLEPKP